MSNYGLENFLKKEKIKFFRTKVGDRYVKEKMKKNNFNLGGEQSGHIILGNYVNYTIFIWHLFKITICILSFIPNDKYKKSRTCC